MTYQKILNVPTKALAEIIAGLVMKGLTFEVTPNTDDGELWCIHMLGGY
jgi:hypothetical protein